MTDQNILLPKQIATAVDELDFVLAYRFLMRLWGQVDLETWRAYRTRVEKREREHLLRIARVRRKFEQPQDEGAPAVRFFSLATMSEVAA